MNEWIAELADLEARRQSSVLVTVAAVRGSAPREVGAKMIVTATQSIGTIGGGALEYQCVQLACEQLRDDGPDVVQTILRRFALGANCGQCCGGVVEVMFEQVAGSGTDWLATLCKYHRERRTVVIATSMKEPAAKFLVTAENRVDRRAGVECPEYVLGAALSAMAADGQARSVGDYLLEPVRDSGFHIAIFGAGHVGAATVDVMSRLDCRIRWIDSRRNIFPSELPQNVTVVESSDPAREVAAMPPGSWYLVMTHSHPMDLDICDRILRREDFAYCGLIGSGSKRRRFERLMRKQGMAPYLLERLVCPVGVPGIDGKKPVEIAVAVTAEVLQTRDASIKSGTDLIYREARA